MAEFLGQSSIYSQFLGDKAIIRTYKGDELINEYVPQYIPPADWKDIRVDCPANSIALYAGVKADYSAYDNLGFTATMSASDLTTVGSPTIVDGVASGFSSSNYLSIGTFAPTTPWEAVFRVKTPNTAGARYFLGNLGYGLVVGSTAATNKVGMKLFCSSNGTSWNLANIAAVGQLELDTFYYIRFGFSGTEYYIEYSSDGITYTGRSVSNSTTNIISSNLLIGIGYGSNYYWSNEVDLNNSYIKVNGAYFLMPYGLQNGYKVYIDGNQYGSTYNSGSQCSITWSTSGITTGDDITTPSALKAHKIWIEPATAGNNITAFKCTRVAASGNENQGVLWTHFNLSNDIDIANLFYASSTYVNRILEACTAKNNKINFSGNFTNAFAATKSTYIPLFVGPQSSPSLFGSFNGAKVKKVVFKNVKASNVSGCFNNTTDLEEFKGIDFSATTFAHDFITNATNLKNTVIDMSTATGLRSLGIYGDATHFIGGLKGLIVSNQAPFNHSSLLINVSYTGLDRTAIVNLFNSLPTVSGGQIIDITGCTGNQNKLTIVGSPTISNGEVSSFSDNNYITLINTPFSSSNILDIRIKFIPTEIAQGYLLWTQGVGNGIYLTVVNNQLRYGIACGGNSGITQATAGETYSIQTLNVPYYMHFLFNPHTLNYKLGLSSDGNNPVWGLDRAANAVPNVTGIGFGKTNSTGFYLRGSIDLNETYIKVNDELWFGREQYLLPEDKTIATSKGWSLTTT